MPIDSDRAVWKPVSRRPLVFLRLPALSLLLAAFFTSCTTLPQDNSLYQCNQITHIRQGMDFHPPLGNSTAKDSWDWEAIAEGIKYTSYTATQAPLRWHLVSIDLHNPRLEVLAYPDQDEINSTGTFTGKNTWSFLNKTNAAVTVNATPFKAPLTQLLPQRRLVGLYINRKSILSAPISRYSAICFWPQGDKLKAVIIDDQTEHPPETELALGGFFTIIREGKIQDLPSCSLDSRLALGVTQDQRYLFILYVEGENKKESLGLSYEESALVMQAAGAWDALQMDGGSSASLSVRGKEITGNRHRPVANILGFVVPFH